MEAQARQPMGAAADEGGQAIITGHRHRLGRERAPIVRIRLRLTAHVAVLGQFSQQSGRPALGALRTLADIEQESAC